MQRRVLLPFFLVLTLPVFGQLNLKAGFALSKFDAPEFNNVLQVHNTQEGALYLEPFKDLKLLYGIDLGLEYHWDAFGIEFGWRTKRNRERAAGSENQRAFNNDLTLSISSFYAGLVQYVGPIRLSGSIDYSYVRTKLDFENPSLLTTLSNDGWGSTFSLGYVLKGTGSISLILAPYAQFNWKDYSLVPMQSVLAETMQPLTSTDYFNFGIGLYFLNGPR